MAEKIIEHGLPSDKISSEALTVVARLQRAGYRAYFVGGCVRDLLIERSPKDFDIATEARPEEVKSLFGPACRLIGRRFRLAHVQSCLLNQEKDDRNGKSEEKTITSMTAARGPLYDDQKEQQMKMRCQRCQEKNKRLKIVQII